MVPVPLAVAAITIGPSTGKCKPIPVNRASGTSLLVIVAMAGPGTGTRDRDGAMAVASEEQGMIRVGCMTLCACVQHCLPVLLDAARC